MEEYEVRADVLSADDIQKWVPFLQGKPKLVKWAMKFFAIDKVNWLHSLAHKEQGAGVPASMIRNLQLDVHVHHQERLDHLPEGAFITVSNHPFGALDGILLTWLIGSRRPGFKVMVNMILNQISAMRQYFIAVDALASSDPAKKAVSMKGIKEAIRTVRSGHPLGFFPAGAVSKINRLGRLEDRTWQPNVARIIAQCNVPVVPIFFHGGNSNWFNFLGIFSWKLRTLRLPAEVFKKMHKRVDISIGRTLGVEEQQAHQGSDAEFAAWLKKETYQLKRDPLDD